VTGSVRMFDVGNSGLQAAKNALSTVGHNIANVNTEGYSRQRVEQTAGPPIPITKGNSGSGVRTLGITRTNDEYLSRRIEQEAKNFGAAEERDVYLSQTEQIFNEANTEGLNRLTTNFFNEFRKLSVEPENMAIRAAVRESSSRLVYDMKRMDAELKEVQKNIDYRLTGYVSEFNALVKEVCDLNALIDKTRLGDQSPSPDLLDKRDVAMKRLGGLADISVAKDEKNRVTITLAGKVAVVAGGDYINLETQRTPENKEIHKSAGSLSVVANDPLPVDLTPYLKGGRIGSLIEVRDKDIGSCHDQLNDVAYSLAKSVNAVHEQGFGMDGISGRKFFDDIKDFDSAAEMIKIADPIMNSLESVAAAREANAPGDNRTAIAISNLSTIKGLVSDSDRTISDLYNTMVGELGTKTAAATRSVNFQKDIMAQLEGFRESISGVNLDEETTNLVRFQHAYAANAQVLKVADEVMSSVFTMFR
jgi:flagellar hook-associated protein 1 FlgK